MGANNTEDRRIGLGAAIALLLISQLLSGFELFRISNGDVEEGNERLAAGKPKEALERYNRAAKTLPEEAGVQYNRGIALYKLGNYDDARKALLLGSGSPDPQIKAHSFYNLGNSLFKLKQYKEAAHAYQRALRQDPHHQASKWNLELALRRIEEEKKKQQQKKDKQQQKKDKQQQKQQKDQQRKQQRKQKQRKKEQQSGKKQQPRPREGKKKPEQRRLKQVLDALDRNDKNLQRRRARMIRGGGTRRPQKDW